MRLKYTAAFGHSFGSRAGSTAKFFISPVFVLALSFYGKSTADVGITGTLEYIDNPVRVSEDSPNSDVDDLQRSISLDANYARQTERFSAAFNYRVSEYDYKNDYLEDRTVFQGSGNLAWEIIPERLSWNITNTRTDQVVDFSQADTFDNRQVINIIATGPVYTQPIGSANLLVMQADYAEVDYEDSGRLDQIKKTANASFTRQFSDIVGASVRSSYSETEFEGIFALNNYRLGSLSGFVGFTFTSYSFSVEAGEYYLKRRYLDEQSSPLLNVSAAYTINSRSRISAGYSKSVQDVVSDLRNLDEVEDIDFTDVDGDGSLIGSTNIASVYLSERTYVNYSFTDPSRYTVSLNLSQTDKNTQAIGRDEDNETITGSLSIPVSDKLNLSFSASHSNLEFSNLTSPAKRNNYRANANYRSSDSLRFSFYVSMIDQKSNDLSSDYEGVNAGLSVTYRR